ncbi:dephospho-CoA kinase [Microbacterium sp. YY-01]|uniref:dephospho-CoA kinase n=1 Tax=Microbacterium sp. YY-01 TaxID=3421634 RepID=UPI003D184FF5
MPLIALTGGIASGKTTIARRFAELGAVVVDADRIVRTVQAPGSDVLHAIAAAFGNDVITDEGALDRAALAERVFGRPEALARLNAIVHPAVQAEAQRQFNEAFARDPDAVVVYDVPLLAETRARGEWDAVIVAHAPQHVRLQRLIRLRGMAADAAQQRIASQTSDDARLALADYVVDTSGELSATLTQADEVWEQLQL